MIDMEELPLDTVRVVTNGELQLWNWCRLKWHRMINLRLRPIGYPSYHLHLGSGVHHALQTYYDPRNLDSRGERQPELLEASFLAWHDQQVESAKIWLAERNRNWTEEVEEKMTDARNLGAIMVLGYGPWAAANDDFDVLEVERKFIVPILDKNGNPIPNLYYGGRWDGLCRDRKTKGLYLMEHKTAKNLDIGHLTTDTQHTRYAMAARFVYGGEIGKGIRGSIHTILRKQRPGPRVRIPLFYREIVVRSPRELEVAMIDMQSQIEEMDRGVIFPQFKNDCRWCEYQQLCIARQEGADPSELISSNYWISEVQHEEIDYEEDYISIGEEE